jgi:lipopolysaccharide assembly outer membrane protein LptD (OstA)
MFEFLGFLLAYLLALGCPTPTSWVERDSGFLVPVCGDENGVPVAQR